MVAKRKIGLLTKLGSYKSPPDPLFPTSSSNLFLKETCPKDGGNYNQRVMQPSSYDPS